MKIGLVIKELRENEKLSQEELAAKIKVTTQMISHYENGIHIPRGKTLEKIAKVFNKTIEDLYILTIGKPGSLKKPDQLDQAEIIFLRAEVERLKNTILNLQQELLEIYKKR